MLEIRNLSKQYDNGHLAVKDINLSISESEIVSLVGTSGCGKSTLLRCIAGLEKPSSGGLSIKGEAIDAPNPQVAMLFQEPRLMPWLTVRDNIRLVLPTLSRSQQNERIERALSDVGLSDAADLWPKALSGGMAQRAALARALVSEPSILLLDEPFGALDSFTKAKLQDHLMALWERSRFTLVLVTHDVEEAAILSNRVIVMRGSPGSVHTQFDIRSALPRPRGSHETQYIITQVTDALDLRLSGAQVAA